MMREMWLIEPLDELQIHLIASEVSLLPECIYKIKSLNFVVQAKQVCIICYHAEIVHPQGFIKVLFSLNLLY